MRAHLVITVVLASALAPALARADEPLHVRAAAQTHVDAGLALYAAKDYEAAIVELEAAYNLDPQPALLYATAQAYRLANKCLVALDLYQRFVASAPSGAQLAAARHGIAACEAVLAEPAVNHPEPARVPVAAPPPPPRPAPATPPPAVAVAVVAEPGATPWYADRVGGTLTGAGVVGIGVGATFLVLASRSERRAKTAVFRDDFVHALDEATQRRRIGAVALSAGAGLAAAGIAVYVFRDRRPGRRAVIASDGATIFIAGRF